MSLQDNDIAEKRIFTTGEAAKACGVSQQTIIRCFDSGRLMGFKVPGSKFRRIPREELVRFMKANGMPLEAIGELAPRHRILLVDDDPSIVKLVESAIRRNPALVLKVATTGYDAGLLTGSFHPDLMILDYRLPDIDGEVVCRRVRSREDLAGMRILCVSAVANQAQVAALSKAGADAFLPKPFSAEALLKSIAALVPARAVS